MDCEFNYPQNDEIMTYDRLNHRYVLTNSGVFDQLGINLEVTLDSTCDPNPSTLPDRFLKKISQDVYLYIYSTSMNSSWLEFLLACYVPLRERVREMLQAQVIYVLNNGFINEWAGVNIARGNIMDIDKLRGRATIAPQVEQLANDFIPGLGYCLTYRGQLPCVPCELYHKEY